MIGYANVTRGAAWRRRRGVSIVLLAIILFALVGFFGLMLDTGYVFLTGHQLQNGADAAALAGAAHVTTQPSLAVSAAVSAGAANTVAESSLVLTPNTDIFTGTYNLSTATFTANATPANAVKVIAHRSGSSNSASPPINLIFGPMFGINTASVTRQAIAIVGGIYGIIALDGTRASSFGSNGNITVGVNGAGIQVNSNSNTAVVIKGSAATISATELSVVGGISTSGNPTLPPEVTGASPISDPLASLPEPTKGTDLGSVSLHGKNSSANLSAGYYSGGIAATGGTITLAAGTYLLGPPGLQISGNANLTGNNVTIFLTTGSNPNSYGTLSLGGTGTITLTAPTSGTYDDVVIFQDRNTPYTSGSDAVGGNGTFNITGAVYAPSTDFDASGSSTNLASEVIADTVNFSGNGNLQVNFQAPPAQGEVCLVK